MSKILISKIGYNALTDTNPSHFSIDSDYPNFVLLSQITDNITVYDWNNGSDKNMTTTSTTVSIPNGLPNNNYFYTALSDNQGFYGYDSYQGAGSGGFLGQYYAWVDKVLNNNYFTVSLNYPALGSSQLTVDYTIYLFSNSF